MLPSEKSERWVWRIGIALLIIAILWIVIWVVRSASRSLHRIRDAYHQETGRAPLPATLPPPAAGSRGAAG